MYINKSPNFLESMVRSYRLQWKMTDYMTSMFWLWVTVTVLVLKTAVAAVIKCKVQRN